MQHTEQEIIEHCAKLLWGYNYTSCLHYKSDSEHLSTDLSDYYIPKGLCDEDKFLCFILACEQDSCLNSRFFIQLLGWTKYKIKKIRKKIPFMITMACVGECGGYNGKGWAFDYDFMKKIKEYQKINKPCYSCAMLISSYLGYWYKCPISKNRLYFDSSEYCDKVELEVTESFNNFWK